MMFVQRIRPEELIDLLAAESYNPVLTRFCSHTARAPRLAEFLIDRPRLGVTGTIAHSYVSGDIDGAVPYMTTKQVGGLYAHLHDGCKYITRQADEEWSHCRVPDGALVLNKSGNVGAAAIVACSPYPYVNTVSDLINIRPRLVGRASSGKAIDSGYLVVFLNSPYGQSQLQRLSGGAVFDHVSLHAIPDIRVFEPSIIAQRYVGDKVRQAERLRERARTLNGECRARYRSAIDALGFRDEPRRKTYRATLRERLDPTHYDLSLTSVLDSPWLRKNAQPLKQFIREGSYGDLPNSATYGVGEDWLIRATDLDTCMTQWDAGIRVPLTEVGTKSLVREGDILLEVKGAIDRCAMGRGPVIGKHVNGTIFRLSPVGIHPGYLCLHLTGEIKQKYAEREAVNNIIQYLNLDRIRELPVVRLGDVAEAELGAAFVASIDASAAATGLTAAARLLVDGIIDGAVSDSELVAAQNALEVGDRRADRSILAALRPRATPAPPAIFRDLDQLFALVDAVHVEGKE